MLVDNHVPVQFADISAAQLVNMSTVELANGSSVHGVDVATAYIANRASARVVEINRASARVLEILRHASSSTFGPKRGFFPVSGVQWIMPPRTQKCAYEPSSCQIDG